MAQVQTKTGNITTKTAGTITATNNYAAGNTVFIISSDNFGDGAGTQISSISDGANTWQRATGNSTGNNVDTEIWYAFNVAAGKPPGTIAYRNSVSASILLVEYSGLSTSNPLDKVKSAVGTSTAPASGNTAVLTQPNETVIGVVGFGGLNTGTANTPVTGYGNLFQETNGNGQLTNAAEADKVVTATTAQSIGMTLTLSNEWVAICATFKNAGAGTNLIQSIGASNLGLGSTLGTFPSNMTAGNLIVVGVTVTNALTVGTVSSITDSQSNTYQRAIRGTISEATSVIDEEIWYASNITGGTGVITVNHTIDNAGIYAREYSGFDTFDASSSATGSTTAPNTGTVTPAFANELLIVSTGDDKGNTQTYVAAGLYGDMVGTTTTLTGISMEDNMVSSIAAQTGTVTFGSSANWVSLFASFYKATSGATTTGYRNLMGVGR